MAMLVAALVAHALTAPVGAFAVGKVHDLFDCFLLDCIDWGCPQLRGKLQPIRLVVDDEHLRRAFDDCRMGRHQADRPRAVNRNALTRKQAGQFCCMPTGGKNIREHDVVVFTLLGVLRQYQAVEVRIRHTQQLSLPALIRPMSQNRKRRPQHQGSL